jgi:hypothetical protein
MTVDVNQTTGSVDISDERGIKRRARQVKVPSRVWIDDSALFHGATFAAHVAMGWDVAQNITDGANER